MSQLLDFYGTAVKFCVWFIIIIIDLRQRTNCATRPSQLIVDFMFQMMLQKRQFVMWLDASVQLTKTNMDSLFLQAKKYGVMMWHNGFSLPAHTHLDTFNFLEEPPCLYKGLKEWHAGLILFHSGHEIVKKYILDSWVKCALIEDCMKTKHDEMAIIKCPPNNDFHGCHRFDQAVLSILIFRLYHDSFRNHDVSMSYFRLVYVKNKN